MDAGAHPLAYGHWLGGQAEHVQREGRGREFSSWKRRLLRDQPWASHPCSSVARLLSLGSLLWRKESGTVR